jgi:hypothetical protein
MPFLLDKTKNGALSILIAFSVNVAISAALTYSIERPLMKVTKKGMKRIFAINN